MTFAPSILPPRWDRFDGLGRLNEFGATPVVESVTVVKALKQNRWWGWFYETLAG